jgi:hypothetical protein
MRDSSAGWSRGNSETLGPPDHSGGPLTIQRNGFRRLFIVRPGRTMPAETAASAVGVVTALGRASGSWQDELWAGSVGLVDGLIRSCYGIYEFTDDPGCVLRIGMSQARAAVTLSDGTKVEAGEPVGTLHFWNEHLPHYPPEGPNLLWACGMRDQMRRSLRSLAEYVEHEPSWREIRALRGEYALSSRLGTQQVRRVGERYGFERVRPTDPSLLDRLHAVGEGLILWSLTRAFHPAALPRQPFMRDHHELWISRGALIRRYGRQQRKQARTAMARPNGE